MSVLTEKLETQLRKSYQQPILQSPTQGIWYTGADLLEDLTLCRTSLQQQAVRPGQAILISATNPATIPVLLIASWQLGLTVTLAPASSDLPELMTKRYAAMAYSTSQTLRLAKQVDPQKISLLTLLLNTAPDFAYFVHDLAPQPTVTKAPALVLPLSQTSVSQAELLTAALAPTQSTLITNLYDLNTGILPLLANLLAPTPFSLAAAG
ncbi:hypothetical protein RA086_01165 [Lactiplantibacillus sp. WILCCON 0030]|uniref:AMP-dependent synthetase/ligase domain-containing protein n=1 Tax=Lactiplantibacillus brownii TaxID=3069269 RepID=A0ABU1A7E2_9LACO|nr:hypothetical protein [Lactiplantibacillus brownii]MDQ7936260.1 hypothetical protein [Lactiplantibacillus brownii]